MSTSNGGSFALPEKKKTFAAEFGELLFENAESFLADYQAFIQTKRFQRFMILVQDELRKFESRLVLRNEEGKDSSMPFTEIIIKMLRSPVYYHFKELAEKSENGESEQKQQANSLVRLGENGKPMLGFTDAVRRGTIIHDDTPLWAMKDFGVDILKREDEKSLPLIMQHIGFVLNDKGLTEYIFAEALEMACYDYIRFQVTEHNLDEESWYRAVKNLNSRQILLILKSVYERAVPLVEERATWAIMNLEKEDSFPNALRELHIAKTEAEQHREESSEELAELRRILEKKDAELSSLRAEIAQQQAVNNDVQAVRRERDSLAKELKKERDRVNRLTREREQLETLNEQYAELLRFAAQEEPDRELPQDIELQKRRIVFVRDKEHADYVMMKRLQAYFPNAGFTNCIASDINAHSTELIVVLIPYVSHATYWNAQSSSGGVPILKVQNANVGRIVEQIRAAFKD